MKKIVYLVSCLIGLILIDCSSEEPKNDAIFEQEKKDMNNFEKLESNLTTSMYSKYLIFEDTSLIDEKYIFDYFNNESLPYNVTCSVCQKNQFVIISFSGDLAFEYYLGLMAAISENTKGSRKCYCIAINKENEKLSFYSLYSHPYLKTLQQEYYLGRFENGKNFIVNLMGIIDSDMKTNTSLLKENVLADGIDKFLNALNLKKSDLEYCHGSSATEINIKGKE